MLIERWIFVGVIFFLMIPCTYIFMALYALINLNVINWGTREAASAAAGKVSIFVSTDITILSKLWHS